jgi:hypothetical protein
MLIQLQKLYVPFTSLARYTDSFLGCVLFHVRQYGSTSQKYTWAAIISPWPHTTGMYLASVFSCRRVGRLAVTICSESCTRTRACTRAARWRVLLLYSYRQTSRARRRQRYLPKPSSRASHACQFFFLKEVSCMAMHGGPTDHAPQDCMLTGQPRTDARRINAWLATSPA